ncbi:ead/Ea22-like family protein [Enterobacter cloacae complex sp. 2021EL-01169]|uniref:ead/Ea22-like family protein n=1 Tax=Enterobacter cloacae complex sp. 2021EL-01169 TaxID=2887193 RepID=UPI001D136F2D|nr:ead/Ea22-like family protein [Enterobacter cloacae complex sp. 2021EL-01169]MCC3240647.1 ead/Ea22-like family protein [Enterobacter cloacae complex sp. 2021EL-01169]
MSNIDKQALRINAQLASSGKWIKESGDGWEAICSSDDQANSGFIIAHFEGPDAKENREFIQAANPTTVLALLDELEAKDNRINRLEAIVAVAEQRNALMREWKRALKVPCDLVDDQVPVVIHGRVIRLERLTETEEKFAAAAAAGKGE